MEYKLKQKINGFTINSINILNEINSIAYQIEHDKTKAKLIYLNNKKEKENLFSVAIRTPPIGNFGIPHILEHCILCGSRKYPFPEIFTKLLKSSMATFINAMTYSDKTVYPFTSINETDFINLLKVYCDAIFYPKITKENFMKESYILTKNNRQKDLIATGVVYNEMIGIYSDIIGVIDREITKNIFPNNIYGKDSGGDPSSILKLSYNKLKKYHEKYYHPSNSYILVYGSVNIEKILKILDTEFFNNFNEKNIKINIDINHRNNKNRRKIIIKCPVVTNENKNEIVIVSFLTNKTTDVIDTIAMQIIENYLMDKDSSPLKLKLIQSNICESMIYSGYFCNQLETYFCIGVKGIKPHKRKEFYDIIELTIKEIINNIDRNRINSILNKLEFKHKNIGRSYLLNIMNNIYDSWIYDPKKPFNFIRINKNIKSLINKDNKFFAELMKKYLLDNKNRFDIIFKPNDNYHKNMNNKLENQIKRLTENIKKDHTINTDYENVSSKKIGKIDYKKIPIESLKCSKNILNYSYESVNDIPIISVNMKANDISHIYISFNFKNIDKELIKYLPIFEILLLKLGTKNKKFFEIDELESDISCEIDNELILNGSYNNNNDYSPVLLISAKVLRSKTQDLINILIERLTECNFSDENRIEQIIIEEKSHMENNIISYGSQYTTQYACKDINLNLNINEKLNGISKLQLLNDTINNFQNKIDKIKIGLQKIQKQLLNKNNMTISILSEEKNIYKMINSFTSNFNSINENPPSNDILSKFDKSYNKTFFIAQTEISFNSASIPIKYNMSSHRASIIAGISNYISYDYLWDEIREKNGAYGTGISFSPLNGCLDFYTYRDPEVVKSYNTFLQLKDYINNELKFSKKVIDDIIIGFIKTFNTPIRQSNAGKIAIMRYLNDIDNNKLEIYKNSIFDINSDKIKNLFNEILIDKISMCTISNVKNYEKLRNTIQLNSYYKKFKMKTIL